ncbi:MAG: TIGR01906 family membrane protein [Clostridia bacterium]|nr:TIGR01906 family membrane protein [Clostridia bacterium]
MKNVLLGIVFAILVFIIFVFTAVDMTGMTDISFYRYEFSKNMTEKATSMTERNLEDSMSVVIDYMKGQSNSMNFYIKENGKEKPVFNAREKRHMEDVRKIVLDCIWIRRAAFAAVLFILILLKELCLNRRVFFKATAITFLVLTAFSLVAFIIVANGFGNAFVVFHHILFNNNYWLLDPNNSLLINMLPQTFFSDVFMRASFVALALTVTSAAFFEAESFMDFR